MNTQKEINSTQSYHQKIKIKKYISANEPHLQNKQRETKENNTPNRIKYIVFKQNFENIRKRITLKQEFKMYKEKLGKT